MTKEHEEAIGKILSFSKGVKRRRVSNSKAAARQTRTRWPHFIDMIHAEFREVVYKFDDGLVNSGRSKKSVIRVVPADDSITAKASRFSVTITNDPDTLTLVTTCTILDSRDSHPSKLPFYCRLGEDGEIEIHDSPEDDRMIPLSTFVFKALWPLFSEVVHRS